MRKYSWSLYKTIQFVSSRRNDINLKPGFINQLSNFETKLIRQGIISKSNQWNEPCKDPEEEVLRNTYINSQIENLVFDYSEEVKVEKREKSEKIAWCDEKSEKKTSKLSGDMNFIILKSCLKGGVLGEVRIPRVQKPIRPKRSISLNLQKNNHNKEELKNMIAQHPTQEKNTHLFR